jgi:hypothetical protein
LEVLSRVRIWGPAVIDVSVVSFPLKPQRHDFVIATFSQHAQLESKTALNASRVAEM